VNSSVNLGQPLMLSSPNKQLARAIATLADGVTPSPAPQKKRSGWFSLMS